jgi:pimeloyl-ACP methyl ester carboxylesterase
MRSKSVYTLEDMADDAAALLDHLDIDGAHIVGASMGGMIAQIFAARYRPRTRSLALIFTNNNQRFAKPASPRGLLTLLTGPPPGSPRDVVIDHSVKVSRFIGSPLYPVSEERLRAEAIETHERCYYPWGYTRQLGAILGSGSLLDYDRQITEPTVVLHGRADKLVPPASGRAVARAIDGARLVLLDGMGHDLPEELWDEVISELTTNFSSAR